MKLILSYNKEVLKITIEEFMNKVYFIIDVKCSGN